jgi:virginiamycin B lyase
MPTNSQPVRHSRFRPSAIALVLVAASCVFAAPAGASGYVFWGNDEHAVIGRADRDGTNVDRAFAQTPAPARHVAVSQGRVYWNWGGGIGRANADGSGDPTQTFVTGLGSSGRALTADDAFVYWSRGFTSEIGRVPIAGTPVEYSFLKHRYHVTALAVDANYLYYAHRDNRIGRYRRDGSAPDEPDFFKGASGIHGLAVDHTHIYWSETRANRIGRANLDGSQADHSFITGADEPLGVAVDAHHVYWANEDGDSIGRANLDGSAVDQSFIDDVEDPYGVAVSREAAPTPELTGTTPPSPANENAPRISGHSADGTTVTIYDDAACTHPVATGDAAALSVGGIAVAVPDDSTTTFRATAGGPDVDTSACSAGLTYIEDSTPPALPVDVTGRAAPLAFRVSSRVTGVAEPGSLIRLFTDPTCSGDPVATGDAATFASPGIEVPDVDPTKTAFYVTATDAAGNASACTAAAKKPDPGLSDPQVGKTANIAPVSGTTTVKCPGTTNDQLTVPRQIPIGCTLDTTNGRVSVTTANGQGANQTANFYDGKFKLLYTADKAKGKKTVFTLVNLVGPKPKNCKKSTKAKRGNKGKKHAAASKARKGRRLWGSGKGRYRTRGSHSAATVRGTIWLTKDTCAGTLTVVKRGVVDVWDFGRHKRVTVRKGHRYLARASRGH